MNDNNEAATIDARIARALLMYGEACHTGRLAPLDAARSVAAALDGGANAVPCAHVERYATGVCCACGEQAHEPRVFADGPLWPCHSSKNGVRCAHNCAGPGESHAGLHHNHTVGVWRDSEADAEDSPDPTASKDHGEAAAAAEEQALRKRGSVTLVAHEAGAAQDALPPLAGPEPYSESARWWQRVARAERAAREAEREQLRAALERAEKAEAVAAAAQQAALAEGIRQGEMRERLAKAERERAEERKKLDRAVEALTKAERERDAYKRAKAENDERFMRERDVARRERDEARREAERRYAPEQVATVRVPNSMTPYLGVTLMHPSAQKPAPCPWQK